MADAAELTSMCSSVLPRRSAEMPRRSHALELEPGLFTWGDPKAMAMLCFYINRAGSNLTAECRQVLERAKLELRALARHDPLQGPHPD